MGRLQSVRAVQQWWSLVVEARKVMDRGEVRVRVAGLGKLGHGMCRCQWQLSGLVLQWRQCAQCRQVDSVRITVVRVWRGRIMSKGLWVWKGQARVARGRVAEEARHRGQAADDG